MKATAVAPANIAFIKYWGKQDEKERIPLNDSISMNLSGAQTITTVEFSEKLQTDVVDLLDGYFSEKEVTRVVLGLDRIRNTCQIHMKAKVVTKNSFPKGAGSAASASGFAALTVAGFTAVGRALTEKELTIVSRRGSGSACRSIPNGFVMWKKGDSTATSFAYSLHDQNHWDIRDALVVVDSGMKKISTTEGMDRVHTSPRLAERLAAVPSRIDRCVMALKEKNFVALGEVSEEDCLDMHTVMQTQVPPLMYWNDVTVQIMDAIRLWRKDGLPVYFTIDAGPNVHVLYEGKNEEVIMRKLQSLGGVEKIISNSVAQGTHVVTEHLF